MLLLACGICTCRSGHSASLNVLSAAPAAAVSGGGLDLKSLCLVPGKTCWVVFVDALVLNDGGNVLDALSIATRAALALTRVYKASY